MCNLSRGVEARGIRKGLQQGRREGRSEGIMDSLRNLMESMGWGIAEAMNALRIPEEERQRYIDALANPPRAVSHRENTSPV